MVNAKGANVSFLKNHLSNIIIHDSVGCLSKVWTKCMQIFKNARPIIFGLTLYLYIYKNVPRCV
jgi:hypothetical protein